MRCSVSSSVLSDSWPCSVQNNSLSAFCTVKHHTFIDKNSMHNWNHTDWMAWLRERERERGWEKEVIDGGQTRRWRDERLRLDPHWAGSSLKRLFTAERNTLRLHTSALVPPSALRGPDLHTAAQVTGEVISDTASVSIGLCLTLEQFVESRIIWRPCTQQTHRTDTRRSQTFTQILGVPFSISILLVIYTSISIFEYFTRRFWR